ncbi:Thiol:disulfide interchange protein dsbA precursor [Candidatus Glomeribacter gigasporarum BEG34]|uniref:Thiol:disulfide interchange protein n=1 Tax=Candidatus Glomeribacter gigasporarum BEG34 TaxID=1070319 RepID=G2J9W4_9BURK|nr:thiol:disulfide interchange protein DsbA/DsbL [Candidatus Glomeribacter gigasporarum]CCD29561.1 Thiol:disulfide interchange protein dsbA precursor [Candidatus Glomeribacter gigasporarum BEG34]
MKKLLLMGLIWMGCAAQAAPAPAAPQAGKDYKVLENPQPVNAPAEKIEILEFFMYGCPHCEHFEPVLTGWVKKQSPDIVLKHVPLAFNKALAAHQKLYHALDALGLADQLTPSIFKAIHTERNYLLTPEAQAAFLAKKGVDKKKFLAAYHSFETANAVQRDNKWMADYKITATPALIVQGKYETSPAMTNNLEDVISVLDFLMQQIRAEKM